MLLQLQLLLRLQVLPFEIQALLHFQLQLKLVVLFPQLLQPEELLLLFCLHLLLLLLLL